MECSCAARVTLVVGLSLGAACGDDSPGTGGLTKSKSGVDAAKRWSEIDDQDARAFCKFEDAALTSALPDSEEQYCLAAWAERATCAKDVAECMASDEYETEKREHLRCDTITAKLYFKDYPPCAVTIGDFEKCVLADAARDRMIYENASCTATKLADADDTPECESVLALCDDW